MNKTKPRKWCTSCAKWYTGYPAISRKDNKTEICSKCGTREAFDDFFGANFPSIYKKEGK